MRKPIYKDRYSEHKIYPSKSFMQRVKVYVEKNKSSSFFEFFKNNYQRSTIKK